MRRRQLHTIGKCRAEDVQQRQEDINIKLNSIGFISQSCHVSFECMWELLN